MMDDWGEERVEVIRGGWTAEVAEQLGVAEDALHSTSVSVPATIYELVQRLRYERNLLSHEVVPAALAIAQRGPDAIRAELAAWALLEAT